VTEREVICSAGLTHGAATTGIIEPWVLGISRWSVCGLRELLLHLVVVGIGCDQRVPR
jgi:hypothetical protein